MSSLSRRVILASPSGFNDDLVRSQLVRLDRMIDAEQGAIAKARLCGAFQALNWARSPDSFAAPSEGL